VETQREALEPREHLVADAAQSAQADAYGEEVAGRRDGALSDVQEEQRGHERAEFLGRSEQADGVGSPSGERLVTQHAIHD
jgi:hypothetical protein